MKLAAFIVASAAAAVSALAQTYSVRIDRVNCDIETYENALKDPSALDALIEKAAENLAYFLVEAGEKYEDVNSMVMPVAVGLGTIPSKRGPDSGKETVSELEYRDIGSRMIVNLKKKDALLLAGISIDESFMGGKSVMVDGREKPVLRRRSCNGAGPVVSEKPVLFKGFIESPGSAELYVITVAEK